MKTKIFFSAILAIALVFQTNAQLKVMNTTGNIAIGNISDPAGYKLYLKNGNYQLLTGGNEGIGANMLRIFSNAGCNFAINSYNPIEKLLITDIGINYSINGANGTQSYTLDGAKKAPMIRFNAEVGTISMFGEDGNGNNYREPCHHLAISIGANGYVGIGQNSANYLLDVNGTIRVVSTLYYSDARLKENITNLNSSLKKLSNLRGVKYKLKTIDNNNTTLSKSSNSNDSTSEKSILPKADTSIYGRHHNGFLANEMQKVYPELVYSDKDGMLSIDYIGLIPVLVEAIKEQQVQIETLKKQVGTAGSLKSAFSATDIAGTSLDAANLAQNAPNPFNESTNIKYYLPESVNSSQLNIYDMNGVQLRSIPVTQKGDGIVTIHASELRPGMYYYALIADGKEVDTKKMIITE